MKEAIRWALILSALGHVAIQVLDAIGSRRWSGRHAGFIRAPGDPRHVGSPSLTGCYLAIVLPLAPPWAWPVLGLGLWWSGSWLAYVALGGAIALTGPPTIGWVPIALLSGLAGAVVASRRVGGGWRWAEWTPRGDSLDSLTLRFQTWRVVSRALLDRRLWPWGRRPIGKDLRRYQVATGVSVMDDHVFNEYLQVIYEAGLFGAFGVVVWAAFCLSLVLDGGGLDGVAVWRTSLLVWALTMMGSLTLRTWPFPLLGLLMIAGACAS